MIKNQTVKRGSKVILFFSCSTQLSMKFLLVNNIKRHRINVTLKFISPKPGINSKMPTIVGILTFMRRINFMLSS